MDLNYWKLVAMGWRSYHEVNNDDNFEVLTEVINKAFDNNKTIIKTREDFLNKPIESDELKDLP